MALLDPNELAQTIIDQAHTIRRMGAELERLQIAVAEAQPASQPEPLRSVPDTEPE